MLVEHAGKKQVVADSAMIAPTAVISGDGFFCSFDRINGTLQNRAKVVDSLPGYTSDMAGGRHNLAT